MKNLVAIVGRPNTGKSSLFNRVCGKRNSIVDDMHGVTRDRLYEEVEWQGKKFNLVDTGGIEVEKNIFQDEIKVQAQIAINEAEVIVFVVDGQNNITIDDEMVANMLYKTKKPVLVAANKLESQQMDLGIYSLGFESIFPISALHGNGIGNILDKIIEILDFTEKDKEEFTKISIIGKPNVGKSSLLNRLVKKERSIVSDVSGTTRDSIKENIVLNDRNYTLIDTAGIMKKSRLVESVEHYALLRAMSSLKESDITLLVLDATKEIARFDYRIAGYAFDERKPIIIIINKWDLITKQTNTMIEYVKKLRKAFKFIPWAKIVFFSALTGQRETKLLETLKEVQDMLTKKIKTNTLNEFIYELQLFKAPPMHNGGRLRITFLKQVDASIPTFLLFVNNPLFMHFSYKRYIENKFREYFGYEGTPINFVLKRK
ncbi:MAG: ribosome biogenesis GTPase Der [Mycoplasma sp.]|nr:ribosome biogenesis GTPase Der [Mycoplasma sp.]